MISIEPLLNSDFTRKNVMAKIEWLKTELVKRYSGKFYSLKDSWKKPIAIKENEVFLYDSQDDCLFVKGMRLGGLIYQNREWAKN